MTPPLFLLATVPDSGVAVIDGEEARHAAVKRIVAGEVVLLSDGRGALATGTVLTIGRDRLEVSITARRTVARADPAIVVVQALPKGEHGELAVDQLTEAGVDGIVPWAASRCVTQWRGERATRGVQKWRRAAREAAKQSRRAWVPDVSDPASTADVVRRGPTFVLHESATESLAAAELPDSGELVLVIGPEGGVSDDEIAAFTAAGARAVRMGPEVLRTSSAGLAAVAALSVRLGRWA